MLKRRYIKYLLLISIFFVRAEGTKANASDGLPSKFDYNDFLAWIKGHNYENIPEFFGFNPGSTAQYPSENLAVSVVCNLKRGCNNFVLWPFDEGEVGILYYNQPQNFAGGARVSSLNSDASQLINGVIDKVYIPMLDKNFTPAQDWTKPDIIGNKGIADWAPFVHVDYNMPIMVIYFNIAALQSSETRLLFEDNPGTAFIPEKILSPSKYMTRAAPLTQDLRLINGTTWKLVSREGVGPAYDGQSTDLNYSYSITNGLNELKSRQLGLTLGLNLSATVFGMGSTLNSGLSASWGTSVSVQESSTSSLSATCSNTNSGYSKICPTYQLMATTLLTAPGINLVFDDLNGSDSKTPDVKWQTGEGNITDDGHIIGVVYPIGGVFHSRISVTQRADYIIPLHNSP